jgi:hypothetical protein
MRRAHWLSRGATIGAGLLSKSYFLALIFFGPWQAVLLAAALAGWWFAHNVLMGYSFSGWILQAPPPQLLTAVRAIDWPHSAHVSANTFIWWGAWSFVTLKSWVYAVLEVASAIAAARTFKREFLIPWLFTLAVFAEMAFGAAAYQASQGTGTLAGWYGWVAGPMMAVILAGGVGRLAPVFLTALAGVDIYGATLLARHWHAAPFWLWLIPLDLAMIYIASGGFAALFPSRNRSNQ